MKAKNIKDTNELEYYISIIKLIFCATLMIGAIIETNKLMKIFVWIILGFYTFKLFAIRRKILYGYYDSY